MGSVYQRGVTRAAERGRSTRIGRRGGSHDALIGADAAASRRGPRRASTVDAGHARPSRPTQVVGEEAHLGRPRRVVDLDQQRRRCSRRTGRTLAATAAPTASSQRPNTPPTSARPAPPRSDRSSPSSASVERHRIVAGHRATLPARHRSRDVVDRRSPASRRGARRSGAAAGGTAAGRRDHDLARRQVARAARPPGRGRARTARRRAPAPASTRCARRPGGGRPRRSASASVRCSPCEACVRAGMLVDRQRRARRGADRRSTRRGARRRRGPRPSAAASPARRHGGSYAQLDRRRPPARCGVGRRRRCGASRSTSVARACPKLLADVGQPGVPHVERRRRRLVEPPADLAQQRVALAHDAIELEAQRRRTSRPGRRACRRGTAGARPGRP